ncbi:di- and tricarboxylate transporter [Novosphingobium marinum]|uniref:Sodium-dependent dicarboxylate transporter 2/3/5 n=1 Tax=Novosphingobium marinum TaxID=1514948 RepID=A0A7Y9XX03_9SPHN|nr:DASS family sodium-coupled anion symporter [Novosphingobium marinum]NYH95980.1 sodium-dependent dicarboxylate transporter 2/3/5 [Novosphingobium marinum]GGC31526.1 di- and tricarboxylate transporter [Novosphingobium marinum]
MSARRIGFIAGIVLFALTLVLPAPAGMPAPAWPVAGLVALMAAWWMTEALPLTVTALMPFLVLPFAGVMTATETAASYYSPTLFLILGGAFIALAIERTGLHRRLALAILDHLGKGGGSGRVLLAFMLTAAVLSMAISNTSSSLIMMPMALAVLAGGGIDTEDREGLAGALPMGIAFGATIGGLATIVGSPTNAIAVALFDRLIGVRISFAEWTAYGLPVAILGVPLAAFIIARVQGLKSRSFDLSAAREAVRVQTRWTLPERRLVPLVAATFALWMLRPLIAPWLPEGSLTDGTIAIAAGVLLFVLPDGTGRPLLVWEEGDRAPWGVITMFGGGLALAAGMGASGLADWLGQSLLPLRSVPLPLVAVAIVAMVVLVTEFASNVATASGIVPVVASLTVALGVDPLLLAMPAALAASWGFMLPAGTGPNAIAWSTGHIALPRMVKAGIILDIAGIFLLVAVVWTVRALL